MVYPGFWCGSCGEHHEGVPLSYGSPAPAYWHHGLDGRADCFLAEEQCVVNGEHFFLRGRLVLPVIETGDEFDWGVWVSVSRASYDRILDSWDDPDRVREPPCFGWLSSDIAGYEPTTLNLKTRLHTQPVGYRPTIELEPTDHPLAVEQRHGIPLARVQTIAEHYYHPQ
jgi:hypothetical protein